MLDKVRLVCAQCGNVSFHSVPYIEGQIKAMKIEKGAQAAVQMHNKAGPFYDRWLAAMEARGKQKRCVDCAYLDKWVSPRYLSKATCRERGEHPGRFSCKWFEPK